MWIKQSTNKTDKACICINEKELEKGPNVQNSRDTNSNARLFTFKERTIVCEAIKVAPSQTDFFKSLKAGIRKTQGRDLKEKKTVNILSPEQALSRDQLAGTLGEWQTSPKSVIPEGCRGQNIE